MQPIEIIFVFIFCVVISILDALFGALDVSLVYIRTQIDFIFDVCITRIVCILLSYLFAVVIGFLIGRLWHLLYGIFGIHLLYIDVELVYIFIYYDAMLTIFIDCILFAFRVRIEFSIRSLFLYLFCVFRRDMSDVGLSIV